MKLRIHAGHAFAKDRCAIAVGKLEDDDPQTLLMMYDEEMEGNWGYAELPRIIFSVTSMKSEIDGYRTYVALSDEGDVYFLEGDIPVEKIPGAGVRSEDAEDLGPMNDIYEHEGQLFACGLGSQVYRRRKGGGWERIGERGKNGLNNSYLAAVAATDGGARVAAVGHSHVVHRLPTPDEKRQIDAAAAAGDLARRSTLRAEYGRVVSPPIGQFFLLEGGVWSSVDLPTNGHMNHVEAGPDRRFWCAGDGATLIAAASADSSEDLSLQGSAERLYATRFSGGRRYLLGDLGIKVFDSAGLLTEEIPLPPGLSTPNGIDIVEDTIWYFDYQGLARRRGTTWERLNLPQGILDIVR
jgi:hypothetical protein